MIEYVHGILTRKSPSLAVVEAGGVGYAIDIPLSTFQSLPQEGAEVTLLTHHHVREDVQRLFGFATDPERQMFRELIGVNQVGPKVALSVLSKVSVADLVSAVARGDAARLKSVPGIGPKTAERLVVELRGKLKAISIASQGAPGDIDAGNVRAGGASGAARMDASEALLALGYNDQQIARAMDRVAQVVPESALLEEWIRRALQVI